jgi:PAS domain S-box-containing protein
MIRFLTCTHLSESPEDLKLMEVLKRDMEGLIGEKVQLIVPRTYQEEQGYLEESIDLLYLDPLTAYDRISGGFLVFKIKGLEKEKFFLVGRRKEEDNIIITASVFDGYMISALLLTEFDLLREVVYYTNSQREAYERVLNGEADVAILYSKSYYLYSRELGPLPVLKEIEAPFTHCLLISSGLYQKISDGIKRLDYLEEVRSEEKEELYELSVRISQALKVKQFFDIGKFTIENPNTALILYRDKIVYASKSASDILGYSHEEFKNLFPTDFVADRALKELLEKNARRRLLGELFDSLYPEVKVKTKNGKIRYIRVFGRTVLYQNRYHGSLLFHDITKEVLYQKLYRALRNVNKAITTVFTEEELFNTVCETLVKELDIKFAWAGLIDEKGRIFKKIYKCGEEEGYMDYIVVCEGCSLPSEGSPLGKAIHSGQTFVVFSTEEASMPEKNRKEMLKREFASYAFVPIKKKDKVYAVLCIYATLPYFFEEESLLEELRHDLSFALERIEIIRRSIILESSAEKGSEWIMITDEEGFIEYVNDYVCGITGYEKEELLGKKPSIFKSGYHSRDFYGKLWETIGKGREFEAIFINRAKDGRLFYLEEKIIPVELPGGLKKYVAIGRI